jgi:hypothetical protein
MTFNEWYDICLEASNEFLRCKDECEESEESKGRDCRRVCEDKIAKELGDKYGADRKAALTCAYIYMSDLLDWL